MGERGTEGNGGVDIHAVVNVSRKLFQGARTEPPERFQHWALDQINSVVPFDSAKWVSGSVPNEEPFAHAICLYHFPEKEMEDYLARIKRHDPLLQRVRTNPGKTFDLYDTISREAFVASDLYQTYARHVGVEHAISTLAYDEPLGLFSSLSIYRADFGQPFSNREKQYKNSLFPILLEARNLNIFLNLRASASHAGTASAICDSKGVLRDAENSLTDLLRSEWPQWQGPTLPLVPENVMVDASGWVFTGSHIVIQFRKWANLVEIKAREKNMFDSLTPSEQQVSQYLIQGMTNKEVAKALGVSPKTVANHLHHIYAKLDVPNRQRAIAMLKGEL